MSQRDGNEGQTIRLDDEKRVGGGIIKIYLMNDDVHSLCCSPKNVLRLTSPK